MPLQEEGNLENYLIEKAGVDIDIKQHSTKQVMFTKKRLNTPNSYTIGLYHPYVDSVLAEVRSQKYDSKMKHVKLYSPELQIEFRNTGKLGLATEYEFRWQDERYIWRRGPLNKELECKMMPERGPGIGVAIFNPKKKSSQLGVVTVMYFNMDRLDVLDKKGLEHVILITLTSILDKGDGLFTRRGNAATSIPAHPAQASPTITSPRENEIKKLDKKSRSDEVVATELAEKEAVEANVETEKRIREAKEQERRDKELARRLAELEFDDKEALERQEQLKKEQEKADEEYARRLQEEEDELASRQTTSTPTISTSPTNSAQPSRTSSYSATSYTNDTAGRSFPNTRFSMYPEQSNPHYSDINNRPTTFYDVDYSRRTQGFPSIGGNGISAHPGAYYPDVRNGGYGDVRNGGYSNYEPMNPISPIQQQQYANPFPHPYQQQYSYQYPQPPPPQQPQQPQQPQYLPQTQAQPQMQPPLPPSLQHQYGQTHPQVQSPSQHQYIPQGETQIPPLRVVSPPPLPSKFSDQAANIYPATADPFSDTSAYAMNNSVYPPDSSSITSTAAASSAYNYNTHATHPPLAPIITNPAILKMAQPLNRSATMASRSSVGSTSSLHRTLTMTSRGSPSSASEKSSQSADGSSGYFGHGSGGGGGGGINGSSSSSSSSGYTRHQEFGGSYQQTDDSFIYAAQPIVAPLDPIVSSPFAESRGHTDLTFDSSRNAKREGFRRMEMPTSPTMDSYDDTPRVKGLNISRVETNSERSTILMPEPTIGTP